MSAIRERLRERYDRLWSANIGKIRDGAIQQDAVLASGLPDKRRGLTAIARPFPQVRRRVAEFLDDLRRLEPDQHYYAASEFHVTILSLFTATTDYERFLARTGQYVAAVDSAVCHAAPIEIEFAGVTISPGAVMIQGFCDDDALNEVRDALRLQLQANGLAEGVDARYRLETAHMTVVRFRDRLLNGERFATALERARERRFGTTRIRKVSLVKNDWYMTEQALETVARYRL